MGQEEARNNTVIHKSGSYSTCVSLSRSNCFRRYLKRKSALFLLVWNNETSNERSQLIKQLNIHHAEGYNLEHLKRPLGPAKSPFLGESVV